MADVWETCLQYGVEQVILSGIVFRRCRDHIERKRLLINSLIKVLCEDEWVCNTRFVDNSIVFDCDLHIDGLHLVEGGSVKHGEQYSRGIE